MRNNYGGWGNLPPFLFPMVHQQAKVNDYRMCSLPPTREVGMDLSMCKTEESSKCRATSSPQHNFTIEAILSNEDPRPAREPYSDVDYERRMSAAVSARLHSKCDINSNNKTYHLTTTTSYTHKYSHEKGKVNIIPLLLVSHSSLGPQGSLNSMSFI